MEPILKSQHDIYLDRILSKFRKPIPKFVALMPLSALTLSACGGGSGETTPVKTSTVISGSVLKGQITNALVFSDLNSNGLFNTSEPNAYTDVNGTFNLTTSDASAKLIALGQVGSIDKSTGASAENISFSGTSAGTVISPFSTVITEGGMTSKELADSLGLGDVDLLNFNPFTEGVNAATALLVENTSHQLENVINSFTEATKGSGLTAEQAKKTALDSFAAAVKEKLALKETFDLSNDVDLAAISANVTKSMTLSVAEAASLKTKLDTVSIALKNVNAEVKKVADLTSDATKGVFSLSQLLKDQIADSISKATSIDLVDSVKIALAAANLAPSDLKITSSKIAENTTDLTVGIFSATDEDPSSLVYNLAGTDVAKFSLSETGELSLKFAANYEIQNSYELVVNVEDAGGKKSASKFQIDVENENDPATGSVSISGTPKEDEILTADISKIIDEDSSDIASIAKYQWLRDGTEIVGATSKALTLSQSDVDSAITVNVSYEDGSGTVETFTSTATAKVADVINESIGAISVEKSGNDSAPVLDFYLDETKDKEGDGIGAFDLTLTFDPDSAIFVSLSDETNLTVLSNTTLASTGKITVGAFGYPNFTDMDKPIFSIQMIDSNATSEFVLTLSDLEVDGAVLDGSIFII